MRGFVVCPASKSDAAAVTRAAIGGDQIGSGVAFDLLIPDVHARAVAVELVSEHNVVFDRLLDKDPVAAIGGAGVEEGGAVDGMGVQIDPVHVIPGAHIPDGVDAVCNVTPDSTAIVSIHIAAIKEDRIAAFSGLRVNPIPGACNQAGAVDQCDASGVRVDGEVGLTICVEFSTRNRAEACFGQKKNLGEGIGSCPWLLERDAQVRQDAGIGRHEEAAVGRKFQSFRIFADVFAIESNDQDVVGVLRLSFGNFRLYEGEVDGDDFRGFVFVRGLGFFFSARDQGEVEAAHSSHNDRVGVGSVEGGGIKKL